LAEVRHSWRVGIVQLVLRRLLLAPGAPLLLLRRAPLGWWRAGGWRRGARVGGSLRAWGWWWASGWRRGARVGGSLRAWGRRGVPAAVGPSWAAVCAASAIAPDRMPEHGRPSRTVTAVAATPTRGPQNGWPPRFAAVVASRPIAPGAATRRTAIAATTRRPGAAIAATPSGWAAEAATSCRCRRPVTATCNRRWSTVPAPSTTNRSGETAPPRRQAPNRSAEAAPPRRRAPNRSAVTAPPRRRAAPEATRRREARQWASSLEAAGGRLEEIARAAGSRPGRSHMLWGPRSVPVGHSPTRRGSLLDAGDHKAVDGLHVYQPRDGRQRHVSIASGGSMDGTSMRNGNEQVLYRGRYVGRSCWVGRGCWVGRDCWMGRGC